jgi:hypothetical protein
MTHPDCEGCRKARAEAFREAARVVESRQTGHRQSDRLLDELVDILAEKAALSPAPAKPTGPTDEDGDPMIAPVELDAPAKPCAEVTLTQTVETMVKDLQLFMAICKVNKNCVCDEYGTKIDKERPLICKAHSDANEHIALVRRLMGQGEKK